MIILGQGSILLKHLDYIKEHRSYKKHLELI
jgi:hypothetical protein